MALFDPRMFDQQSYQGLGGLLGNAFSVPYNIPQSAGFAPQQQPAPAIDMSARSAPPPAAPLTAAPPAQQSPLGAVFSGIGNLLGPSRANAQEVTPFSRLQAGLKNLASGGITDAIQGFSTGVRTDPQGIAIQQLNATYQALKQSGVPDATARAAALNPEILKTVAGNYFDTKPQFGVIGQDEMGRNQYGFIRPNQEKVTPANFAGSSTAPGAPGTPGANPDLHGDDFLKTLSPTLAAQVKAYAEGRQPLPGGFALKTPYFQTLMRYITQYDPSFDAVNFNARSKTRNDFTSGKSAQSINALNTVIGHLQTLSDAADNLNNTNYPAINSVKNYFENAIGDPRFKQFDTTKKAVVDELTRVWRGSGGSEGDIKTWSEQINNANSPAQLHTVIGQLGELLQSKINSLAETYKQGMGTTANTIQFVTPKSQATLQKLEARASGGASTAAQPNNSTPDVDKQALDWANANPNDPRAAQIKSRLGVK